MTGQICALKVDDRNLNRVKRGIYLSDLNVGSLDSDDLKSDDLSPNLVRDDGILIQANLKPSSIQIGSGLMV